MAERPPDAGSGKAGPPPGAGAPGGAGGPEPPEAVVETRSRFSLVWVIPIVAVLVGAWLAWDAFASRGPEVTIVFETGEGIEAGRTKVQYRDIEIGTVESVALADDLSHVEVTAQLAPGSERFLREGTRFWVARARISAGEVRGLRTLLSGAYIGIDPATEGSPRRHFDGLERPPPVTHADPGRRFTLRAETLGSIEVGSPVHFRGIRVGEVVDWKLAPDGGHVTIEIFVHAPHHERVGRRTRFWNESGFDVRVSADGVRVDTGSLVSILVGGIAFDTQPDLRGAARPGERGRRRARRPVPEDHVFSLYPSRQATREPIYARRERYWLHFENSVGGLSAGAPVVLRGIEVGEVVEVKLQFDREQLQFDVPVLIEIQPERVETTEGEPLQEVGSIPALVERGLRARLGTASLITGRRQVELVVLPDAPPPEIAGEGRRPEIPTIPAPLDEATASVEGILADLEAMPLAEIGRELEATLRELRGLLESTRGMAEQVNEDLAPRVAETLAELEAAAASARQALAADSPTRRELERALVEVGEAARSFRSLADYLERNPEALLRGKEAE